MSFLRQHRVATAVSVVVAAVAGTLVALAAVQRRLPDPARRPQRRRHLGHQRPELGLFGRLNKPAGALDLALNPPGRARRPPTASTSASRTPPSWPGTSAAACCTRRSGHRQAHRGPGRARSPPTSRSRSAAARSPSSTPATNRVWADARRPGRGHHLAERARLVGQAGAQAARRRPTPAGAVRRAGRRRRRHGLRRRPPRGDVATVQSGRRRVRASRATRTLGGIAATRCRSPRSARRWSSTTPSRAGCTCPAGARPTSAPTRPAGCRRSATRRAGRRRDQQPADARSRSAAAGPPPCSPARPASRPRPPGSATACTPPGPARPGVYARSCGGGRPSTIRVTDGTALQDAGVPGQPRRRSCSTTCTLGNVYDLATLQEVDDWSAVKPPPVVRQSKKNKNNTTALAAARPAAEGERRQPRRAARAHHRPARARQRLRPAGRDPGGHPPQRGRRRRGERADRPRRAVDRGQPAAEPDAQRPLQLHDRRRQGAHRLRLGQRRGAPAGPERRPAHAARTSRSRASP